MSKAELDGSGLDRLIAALAARGYAVVGPRVAGPAITYQPIAATGDLPRGLKSVQSPGHYELSPRGDDRLFAYGPGFESLKRYLCPPAETLWVATREGGTLRFETAPAPAPRVAVVGVRSCEIAAIARLDDVFLHGAAIDSRYQMRRAGLFLAAVNCVEPGDTCFCASMQTGPRAAAGFDLALTELAGGRFVVEIGSAAGADVMGDLAARDATAAALDEERALLAQAAQHMGREVRTDGLPQALVDAFSRTEWDDVARRCLACANCTMVCPTCFCHTIDDRTSLAGDRVQRDRRWDSCFGAEFSYIHGGSIRPSVAARYRQFVLHKFSAWTEQFGTFGCVGCGRCITWCPGGIDVTEELRRVTEAAPAQS